MYQYLWFINGEAKFLTLCGEVKHTGSTKPVLYRQYLEIAVF